MRYAPIPLSKYKHKQTSSFLQYSCWVEIDNYYIHEERSFSLRIGIRTLNPVIHLYIHAEFFYTIDPDLNQLRIATFKIADAGMENKASVFSCFFANFPCMLT
jgi:hypothetical protein